MSKEDAFFKARDLVATGMTIKEASNKSGISDKTYYTYLKKNNIPTTRKMKPMRLLKPKFIDLTLKKEPTNVAVIVCQPDQIADVIKGLL